MSFEIIRNAKVEAEVVKVPVKNSFHSHMDTLQITINDRKQHTFEVGSRYAEMIHSMDTDTISALFTDGTYVFYNDVLRDFRVGTYGGFIHSDESINRLSEIIGFQEYKGKKAARGFDIPAHQNNVFARNRASNNNGLFMGAEWSKFELDVKELGVGGQFDNRLVYKYSVFSPNVVTMLEAERLICLNGMTGMADLVTYEVPVINEWRDNLKVVANRIQPEINELMRNRLLDMSKDRASIRQVQKVHDLIERRMSTTYGTEEQDRLRALHALTNVERNLSSYLSPDAFKYDIAEQIDSDITQFDIYNILTEAVSHTDGGASSDSDIQRMTNFLMFETNDRGKFVTPKVPVSQDSDHRRAFFGAAA